MQIQGCSMIEDSSVNADRDSWLRKVVGDHILEQKRRNRWRFIFRSLLAALVISFIIINSQDDDSGKDKPHVGFIALHGNIFEQAKGSANDFIRSLHKAYKSEYMQALIIEINSPGGSPVQADDMFNEVIFFKKMFPQKKVYAVCTDMCTSAAYYLAASADEIYANPSSLVGSIGVLYNGFGFVDSLDKLGIQRRILTAGKNKAFLDPFLPENPSNKVAMQKMLNLVHKQFEDKVKIGRGKRLHVDDLTFSGLFWTGSQAKSMGLIDGYASKWQLLREKLDNQKIVSYSRKETVFERLTRELSTETFARFSSFLGIRSTPLS